jgi:Kef-type K+ transport system membrane component KefB
MRPEILGVAAVLTFAAVVGKQACALGALGAKLDWLSIGVGMIPRGEVGLIFASIGLTLVVRGERIIDAAIYSAVVIMVMVTTLITPPALKWSLGREAGRRNRQLKTD